MTMAQVGTATDWASINAGDGHICGLRDDASLWCWGGNRDGQLGDGTRTQRTTPVRIGDATWATVSTGAGHTCGVRSDATLWCWGVNWASQLGDGTTTDRATPGEVIIPGTAAPSPAQRPVPQH